jgi:hypothetical protein
MYKTFEKKRTPAEERVHFVKNTRFKFHRYGLHGVKIYKPINKKV